MGWEIVRRAHSRKFRGFSFQSSCTMCRRALPIGKQILFFSSTKRKRNLYSWTWSHLWGSWIWFWKHLSVSYFIISIFIHILIISRSSLWSGSGPKGLELPSCCHGKNKVPTVHYRDLSACIHRIIIASTIYTKYIPVTDMCLVSIAEVLLPSVKITSTVISFTPDEEKGLELLLDNPVPFIWIANCPTFTGHHADLLALKYPQSLQKNFALIWKEFLETHRLSSCLLLVAGPPKSLKTKISVSLAQA